MDTNAERIEEARRLLAEGKDRRAADLLTMVAAECHDPSESARIRSLALQGRERAGRFGKGRWDEPIRISEMRLTSSSGARAGHGG